MRGIVSALLLSVAGFGMAVSPADAVTVAPTSIEIVAVNDAAGRIILRNDSNVVSDVQVRAMRWTQVGGQDRLDRTNEVVVSPPISRLAPGEEQTVRVVRSSGLAINGEEAYRILIDQLPTAAPRSGSNVAILVRQSVPVFFRSPTATSAPLRFGKAGASPLVAQNSGQTFHRVQALAVKDGSGREVYSKTGLVGYVLGNSEVAWNGGGLSGNISTITGHTNRGAFAANLTR